MLTVIRRDQLVHAVVLLTALNRFSAIVCSLRELVGPVHPIDSCIHVVLVACADFQDARNPVVVRLLPGLHRFVVIDGFLALDAEVVRDVDEAFAEVLDSIHCASGQALLLVQRGLRPARRVDRSDEKVDLRTKLLYLVMSVHLLEGSTW